MASGDDEPNQFPRDLNSQELEEIFTSTSSEEEEEKESFSDDDDEKVPILSINEDPSIKNLKIPKSSGEESDGDGDGGDIDDDHLVGIQQTEETSANKKFPWICEVCKKGFSSGQALGGHSRIHSQPKKQSHLIKRPPNPTTITTTTTSASADSFNSNNAGNNNTCCVCAKSFPSEKSLFGHMRCHPDRDWRGIQPPNLPPTKNSSSSTTLFLEAEAIMPIHETDDHIEYSATTNGPSSSVVVDLSQSLSGWLSTARRGKKSTVSNPGAGSGSGCRSGGLLDEQIPEDVAYNLMMLAHGRHKDDSLNSGLRPFFYKQHERVLDDVPQVMTIPTSSLTNNMMSKIEPQRDQVLSESTSMMKRRMEASDVVEYGINYPAKKLKIEKVASRNNVNNGNEIPIPLKSTEKGKTRQADNDDQDMDDSDTSGDKHVEISYRMINLKNEKRRSTTDGYKCTTCNKSFPTHQALGGHRSSHTKLIKNIPALVKDESAVLYAAPPGLLADDVEGSQRLYANAQVGETEEYDEEAARSRLQQRKACKKTFGGITTSQALEGNKRKCHWTAGPIEAQSSQAGSSDEASHTGRRIPINLNEIPAMEDEEEEEEEEGAESDLAQVPQHSAG